MSNYPGKIDTDAELPSVHDNVSEISTETINALREAIIIIQQTLGVNPQGTSTSLVDRLDVTFNPDGTINSAALASSGLVSLPVTNVQVGASAAIEESKLDLDVPTQDLQDQISSNDVDIAQLQKQLADLLNRYLRHVNGLAERHASSHITHTLADGYSAGSGTTVQTALNYLEGQLLSHKRENRVIQHHASAVSYIPEIVPEGGTPIITATNVQDAIAEIDANLVEDRRKHNDEAHSNGVSGDGYISYNGQATVNDASLKLTRYQPPGLRDQTKIGLCNAPTVKSRGFEPTSIDSNNSKIEIEVKIGTSVRNLLIENLHTISYPVGTSRVSLNGIVDYMNARFADTAAGNHFPVSAFASEDGEIVLQHNIASDDSLITIRDPGALSAVDALGFTDIVDVTIGRVENYSFYINGERYTELKTLHDGYAAHPITDPVDRFDSGVTVDSTGLNILNGDLVHIYNHDSDPDANGTYQVNSVVGTTIEVSEAISDGTFNFILYRDSFTTRQFTGAQRASLDFFLTNEREPETSTRANVTYNAVTGVRVVEVSQNFPALSSAKINATGTGTSRTLEFEDAGGNKGTPITFIPGFIGYLRLYGPNNDSYVTLFVYLTTVATGTIDISTLESERQDNKLLLGTSHVDAATNEVEIPLERRSVGLVGETAVSSSFTRNVLERDLTNLHMNGVVRGFDVISTTSNTVTIRGGQVYIDGKFISKEGDEVSVDVSSDGTYNLVLNKDESFDIFEDNTGSGISYSVAELIESSDHLLLSQITISGASVTDTSDARFFINDIESRLPLSVDDREFGGGSFRSLEAAVLYSKNAPNDTKPEITILSDLTVADDLTIDSGERIVAFGDLTVQSNLTISNDATLVVFGSFTASGTNVVTLNSGATLRLQGTANFGGSISMGARSRLEIEKDISVVGTAVGGYGITTSGDYASIVGSSRKPTIAFSSATGIEVNDGYFSTENLIYQMDGSTIATARYPLIDLLNGCQFFTADNCKFVQTGTPNVLNWTSAGDEDRLGIRGDSGQDVSNIKVTDCVFDNLRSGISIHTGSEVTIDSSLFRNNYITVELGRLSDGTGRVDHISIKDNEFRLMDTLCIYTKGENVSISHNQFFEEFNTSSPPYLYHCSGFADAPSPVRPDAGEAGVIFSENFVFGMRIQYAIWTETQSTSGGGFRLFEGPDALLIKDNVFRKCTSDLLFRLLDSLRFEVHHQIIGNVITEHTGRIITGNHVQFSNNSVDVIDSFSGGNIFIDLLTENSAGTDPYFGGHPIFSNNYILLDKAIGTNNSEIRFAHGIFEGNYVKAGTVTINNSTTSDNEWDDELIITGNKFELEESGLNLLSLGQTGFLQRAKVIITNNDISLAVNDEALNISSADDVDIIISNNYLEAIGNTTYILSVSGTSSAYYNISGNIIKAEVGGLNVLTSNAMVIGNTIRGGSGTDIFVNPAVDNIFIEGNYLGNGTITATGTNKSYFIGANKNYQQGIGFWSFESPEVSGWTVSDSGLQDTGTGDTLRIPLSLPPRVEIVDIEIIMAGAVAGTITSSLIEVNTFGTLTLVSAVNPTSQNGPFSLTPPSGTYVDESRGYFVKISSSDTGNQIGYITVYVRY